MQRFARLLKCTPAGLVILAVLFSGCHTPTSEERSYEAGSWSAKYRERDSAYTRPSIYSQRPADTDSKPTAEQPKARRVKRPSAPKPTVVEAAPDMRASAPVPATQTSQIEALSSAGPIYRLRTGDSIVIYLRGIPSAEMIEDVIDENGYVTLPHINEVMAAGGTTAELEKAIRSEYLSQRIYRDIAVNVVVLSLSYFVSGEVRSPGRYPLMSGVTLVQAIATAGGYTEFANSKKVSLTRGQDTQVVNVQILEKYPERDIPIKAGDVIVVQRSVF